MKLLQIAYKILVVLPLACGFTGHAADIPSGRLYKIGVDHTGIFQITPEQLSEMGFDSADAVAVYGYGGVEGCMTFNLADSRTKGLPEVPTMVTDDGRLLFYGEGPERYRVHVSSGYTYADIDCNSATTMGYYFIGAKSGARRVSTKAVEFTGAEHTTHSSVGVYHPQTTNPAHAGSYFLGDDFSGNPGKAFTHTFPTPDAVPSGLVGLRARGVLKSSKRNISINILGSTSTLQVTSSTNIVDDIEAYFNTTSYGEYKRTMPVEPLDEVVMSVDAMAAGDVVYAAMESVTLAYPRYNVVPSDGSELAMYYTGLKAGDAIMLDRAAGISLWDVTDAVNPEALEVVAYGNVARAVQATARAGSSKLVAFGHDSKQGAVSLVGEVTLGRLSAMPVPDMVILTAPGHRAQAERLASLHNRYQGLDVAVVEPSEVFDEFGSGTRSAYAIRRFMKSLYDRDRSRLRHLLIMGSAIYDPCGRTTGLSLDNTHVLTYQVENLAHQGDAAKCYCSDAFYGMLEDNNLPFNIMAATMSIGVGRIPCGNEAQAIAYVDKAERYLSTPPATDTYSRALIIGDHGDSNGHVKQALEVCDSIEYRWAKAATVTRAMSSLFPPASGKVSPQLDLLKNTFNTGVGYFSYSGHGNPQSLGSGILLKNATANSYRNTDCPFMMFATCYATGYDRNENTIGEMFLLNRNGGAIAVVGSGRAVQMSYNQYVNVAVARNYFAGTDVSTLGDVYRCARNSVVSRYSVGDAVINTACYNMLGDPALPLYGHTRSIALETSSGLTVTPLSNNMIRGSVIDSDGNVDSSFTGKIVLNLYAPEQTTMTQYDRTKKCDPYPVTSRDKLLATAVGTVTGGLFETRLDCPDVATTGAGHRLTVHAIADGGRERAVATVLDVTVAEVPADPELDDRQPPVIEELWIDSPDFVEGDVMDADITVGARIVPSIAGLSLTKTIGRTIYLSVDGVHYSDIASRLTFDSDGVASLSYPVSSLADGPHTVTLQAVDNAGNRSYRTVSFQVVNRPAVVALSIAEKTATVEATIGLTHSFGSEPAGRLVIEDAAGNTVFTVAETTFPYTWNLADVNGTPVPDGRYTARAMVKNDMRHAATVPVTITVIHENND